MAEPLGRRRRVPQHAEVPVRGAERFTDPAEGQQAAVGVHSLREPAEQDRQELALERGTAADPAGEGFDVPHCAAWIEVAQRGEASLRRFRASAWPPRC